MNFGVGCEAPNAHLAVRIAAEIIVHRAVFFSDRKTVRVRERCAPGLTGVPIPSGGLATPIGPTVAYELLVALY